MAHWQARIVNGSGPWHNVPRSRYAGSSRACDSPRPCIFTPACHSSLTDNGERLIVLPARLSVRALLYCGSFYCCIACDACMCVVIVATYGIGSRIASVQFLPVSSSHFRPGSIYFCARLRR